MPVVPTPAIARWSAAKVVDRLRETLSIRGLDIVHPFSLQRYNTAVSALGKPEWELPHGGHPNTLAILVGNTKKFWVPFCEHVFKHHADKWSDEARYPAPVDVYIEQMVAEVLAFPSKSAESDAGQNEDGAPAVVEVRFSHGKEDKFVHLQKACAVSGCAHFNPSCYLNVHAVYGPWLALRCLIVLDIPMDPALETPANPLNPYPDADEAIVTKLKELMTNGTKGEWESWVELRDLATSESARDHRYSEPQIRYHYAYDRGAFQKVS